MIWQPTTPATFVLGNGAALLVTGGFLVWMLVAPGNLHGNSFEGGVVEVSTALLFGIACVGFLVAMKRSRFLRTRGTRWAYMFMICWALLMFVFMGEEISWGQQLFGFETPEAIRDANLQDEFNIHNIGFVDTFWGGKYRWLSLMMFLVGVAFPLFAMWKWGRRIIQRTAFPVLPTAYVMWFVCSYFFGRFLYGYSGTRDTATEVRELLFAIGLCLFAVHGALRPDHLFRIESGPQIPADEGK
jgi:hypothetical protein